MAESLGPGERGRLSLRHAFEEIEAAIVFGNMLSAEMVAPLPAPLGRRVAAFQVAALVSLLSWKSAMTVPNTPAMQAPGLRVRRITA